MKRTIITITFLFVAIFISHVVRAEEEIRDVKAFSKIQLHISGKVYVEQTEKQSLKLLAEKETLEEIVTEVKDGTLHIKFEDGFSFGRWNPGKIEIYISIPNIEGLSVSGSGDIFSQIIKSENIGLKVSGSGNIKIEKLSSKNAKAGISGSGNISVNSGELAGLETSISGSGNINFKGVSAENVSVGISGSGNSSVNAAASLKVRASGSGNVYYSGNPNIDSHISGSGKLKKQ